MEKGQIQEQSGCSYSNHPGRKDFVADVIPANHPIDNIADYDAEKWHDRDKIAHYWDTYFPQDKVYATQQKHVFDNLIHPHNKQKREENQEDGTDDSAVFLSVESDIPGRQHVLAEQVIAHAEGCPIEDWIDRRHQGAFENVIQKWINRVPGKNIVPDQPGGDDQD
jgi:hypothetical protein